MIEKKRNNPFSKKAKKLYYFCTNPIKKLYWLIAQPHVRGAKMVVECDGDILLVRLGYAHKSWTLPGGKVDSGETFLEGALRETNEEAGIELQKADFIGEYKNAKEGKQDIVQCFAARVSSKNVLIDDFEIVDALWCSPNSLPEGRSPRVDQILALYAAYKTNASK